MKRLFFVFSVFIFLFSQSYDPALAAVIRRGDVRKEALDDVRKTVEVFNQIMTEDMNIRLPKEVPVYVTSDTTIYEQVLIKKFKISRSEAKQWADNSGGFSCDLGVALNTSRWVMEKTQDRYEATAHELFHQLQYSLMGNYWRQDPRWLREGTCYLVSSHVVERLGYLNAGNWKRSEINAAITRSGLATAEEVIDSNSSEKWLELSEQKKYPHNMAILLVFCLIDLSKKEPHQSIAEYYISLGHGTNFKDSFLKAFGISYDQFRQDFDKWYADILAKPADIQVIPDSHIPASTVAEVQKSFKLSQSFFSEHWGSPLKTSPSILLASDSVDSVHFMQNEFGFAPSTIEKKTKENPSPFYILYDTAMLNTYNKQNAEESVAFTAASILARMYGNESSSQHDLEGVTWLFYGASDLAAAVIAEKNGNKTLKEQKASWLETVQSMTVLPHLNELQTAEECRKIAEKIGRKNLLAYIRLAACFITEKHGLGSVAEWFRRDKELKNPYKAFEKVFGLSQEKLEQEFLTYLEQQRKTQ